MTTTRPAFLFLALALGLAACQDDEAPSGGPGDAEVLAQYLDLPASPFNYANPILPPHYTLGPSANADNTPNRNPVTDAGATLGRVLFYDVNLSANNSVACASCHAQAHSFSDPAVLSLGFEGGETGRHSMSLANARYYANGRFFWDERAATLEAQALQPIQDHVEMGMTLDALRSKLAALPYYPILFEDAFGSPDITDERVADALAQFVRSMVSYQAKYDTGLIQLGGPPTPTANFPNFTAQENLGRQIFVDPTLGGCAGCHGTDAFIAPEARNNGLDASTTDVGTAAVTGLTADEGKFKSPSLRNVAVTAPYMHDGRFATLEEVIEHYSSGVQAHPNLDQRLRLPNGQPRRLNLSADEKAALIAFLNTLTDEAFLTDEKFADPFK